MIPMFICVLSFVDRFIPSLCACAEVAGVTDGLFGLYSSWVLLATVIK